MTLLEREKYISKYIICLRYIGSIKEYLYLKMVTYCFWKYAVFVKETFVKEYKA